MQLKEMNFQSYLTFKRSNFVRKCMKDVSNKIYNKNSVFRLISLKHTSSYIERKKGVK